MTESRANRRSSVRSSRSGTWFRAFRPTRRRRDLDPGGRHAARLPAGLRATGDRLQPRSHDGARLPAPAAANPRGTSADRRAAGVRGVDHELLAGGPGSPRFGLFHAPAEPCVEHRTVGLEVAARTLGHYDEAPATAARMGDSRDDEGARGGGPSGQQNVLVFQIGNSTVSSSSSAHMPVVS